MLYIYVFFNMYITSLERVESGDINYKLAVSGGNQQFDTVSS